MISYRKSLSDHQTPLEEVLRYTCNIIKKLKSIRFSHGFLVFSSLVLFISKSCAELITALSWKKAVETRLKNPSHGNC